VFVARPIYWGLAHRGEEGVYTVLRMLRDELELALRLMGATDLEGEWPCHRAYATHDPAPVTTAAGTHASAWDHIGRPRVFMGMTRVI
jgi:hypothetical protein